MCIKMAESETQSTIFVICKSPASNAQHLRLLNNVPKTAFVHLYDYFLILSMHAMCRNVQTS